MKQIAQYQDGRLELQEVPTPQPPPGGALVRLTHSVISVGTEKMKVEQAKMNLFQKAKARPDQVRKTLDTARNLGWKNALEKVRNRLSTPTPLGYSAAGIIEQVDPLNTRFKVGDRVACAGAECAFHAEYIAMPDLLMAKIPDNTPSWKAAYTTICAIAMQAVRQSEVTLGDRVLVMGQGLVGLLVTNLLENAGARVMAVDLMESRREYCLQLGAERFINPRSQSLSDEIREWTQGYGVDIAIVCVASQSNAPIEQAADALRDRGRLVDVGITKIELPWKIFYEKELEVKFSRSYGPGRYDAAYEWGGTDYPIGYVRWTEQRNFEACLCLMDQGKLKLGSITTRRAAFESAPEVYENLTKPENTDIGVVLEYSSADINSEAKVSNFPPALEANAPANITVQTSQSSQAKAKSRPEPIVDVLGAGNFAKSMLLPHLKGKVRLRTVVTQTGLNARHVQKTFGFESATTDSVSLFEKPEASGALIAVRHNLHAALALSALKADRHVFIEKPLCLTREELQQIDEAYLNSSGSLQVGFNRRFAPVSQTLKRALSSIVGPKSVSIRVMAGKLDPEHWYANFEESGGRVLGEACHFFDYLRFIIGSPAVSVTAQTAWPTEGRLPFPDSVTAQVSFEDGSSGQLIYSAEGDVKYPKEKMTVYAAGLTAEVENFQKLSLYRQRKVSQEKSLSKGHPEQMQSWVRFLNGKQPSIDLPYEEAKQSMELTFAAVESIQQGRAVKLN
jgi:predicted dehydrogenase/threonine dehydrogenase-like Zn-dependent dehydrogenase